VYSPLVDTSVVGGQAASLLQQMSQTDRESRIDSFVKATRSIAICSGKGGVGKSNLSVNLAILLSSLGKRSLLIDADLGLANDDILMGIRPKHHLYHFLCGQKSLQDILIEGPAGMKLLPGGSGISQLADLREMERKQILTGFLELSKSADILLIDTAAGINRDVLNFVMAAEDTLVVVNPEPTSLLDAFGMVKAIVGGGKRTNIHVVVNKVENEAEGQKTFERLQRTADRFLLVKLHYAGCIFDDPAVTTAVKTQKPFILSAPDSPASRSLQQVLTRIFGLTGPGSTCHNKKNNHSLRTFFRRLVEVFDQP
jgi:flagellar biosynthesis protein FlhG